MERGKKSGGERKRMIVSSLSLLPLTLAFRLLTLIILYWFLIGYKTERDEDMMERDEQNEE